MYQLQSTVALVLLLVVLAQSFLTLRRRYWTRLPPGPPSPLSGTIIPGPYHWRYFERLTHQYGPLVTVWLGVSNPLIVIGTYQAAQELLEKHAGVTADRPRTIMAGEIMSGGMRTLLVGHNERWRRLRKMLHQGLQPKMAASFEPIQQAAAATMLRDVLADPDEFQNHAKKYAASVVMSINYGKTTPTAYTDTDVVEVNECGSRLGAALRPGHYAVDTYHFLSYLPGKWKKEGKEWHDIELALFKRQLQTVRDAMRFGGGADCFGRYIIEHQNEYKLSDDEAAYLAGSIFGAGSDTTASTISIAIMAAVLYPSAVASAQQELDTVVGRDRLPNFEDRSDLPYIEAFRKEVFRWRPVSSGGFRHATTQDLEYQGYTIPAGTAIVGNHWSISRDPAVFSRPEEFRPERWFVDEDAARAELRKDIDHVGYGFGRRACAGKNVADRSTFITISNLLWAFNFTKKRDQAGREIEIDSLAFTDVANSHPLPFAASITPRDEHVVKVVEDESL